MEESPCLVRCCANVRLAAATAAAAAPVASSERRVESTVGFLLDNVRSPWSISESLLSDARRVNTSTTCRVMFSIPEPAASRVNIRPGRRMRTAISGDVALPERANEA